jgi:hypothetical protein
MSENDRRKKPRKRSPNYPFIDLETAIDRTSTLKAKEGGGEHFFPYQAALRHWGYSLKSSNGLLTLAALKKFGLIEDKGKGEAREIRLTDLARKIIYYSNSQEDREEYYEYYRLLKEAALKPSMHRELWEKYDGSLPSDETLRTYLVINRPDGTFAEAAVDEFITQFRSTISFANLIKNNNISGTGKDKSAKESEMDTQSRDSEQRQKEGGPDYNSIFSVFNQTPNQPKTIEIPMPLSPNEWVKIQASYPLSEKAWKQMQNILEAYKPSLVPETKNDDAKKEE